jgi:hypothetical protein
MTPHPPQHNGRQTAALDGLGERLRLLFAHVAEEPPPAELIALVTALDAGDPEP